MTGRGSFINGETGSGMTEGPGEALPEEQAFLKVLLIRYLNTPNTT